MSKATKTLRVAMPAWEIGRTSTGLGAKVGGLGVIVEELPPELVKAAAKQNIALKIETLSPCFAYYDKSKLNKLDLKIPVTLNGHTFDFEVYKHTFPDGQTVIYFWDEWQLGWTISPAYIYPSDPEIAFKLFAAVSQAMAGYIEQGNFDTIHSHDYHVGLIPFYLSNKFLARVPHHFTIHNATYQGMYPVYGRGYERLASINLSGEKLFHKYFDFFDHLNFMKATMIKTHEDGGKITTVSGNIAATWGYAAELRESAATLRAKAQAQKWWGPVGDVFVPNGGLDVFEKLPVAGITNGMSDRNRPENLPELKASVLKAIQKKNRQPLFSNLLVQTEMLSKDHNFNAQHLTVKAQLKHLLHLEAFGAEAAHDPILITAVGRLAAQKNLGLVADIIERSLAYDAGVKFIILASASPDDPGGKSDEARFFDLAQRHPGRVYFNNTFNLPLSKLILAGGDFSLIPSRFEPCGLVDYEASLLGNLVIGRLTGGLAKVRHCAYLYEWLDISDREGEANAFFEQLKAAVDAYRQNPSRHRELMKTAMSLDVSWDKSAAQYIQMYRFGLQMKRWQAARQKLLADFSASLGKDYDLFTRFFIPARAEYGDRCNWQLKEILDE